MKNNSSIRLIPSAEEWELKQRKRRIAEILNSDNYIEQMKELNDELNRTRTNTKVINYKTLKKTESKDCRDGK